MNATTTKGTKTICNAMHVRCNERLSKIRTSMKEANVDLLFIRNTTNIAWISALENVFDEERAHALVIESTHAQLHTDSRYINTCKEAIESTSGTNIEPPECNTMYYAIDVNSSAQTHEKWLANLCKNTYKNNTNAPKQNKKLRIGIEDTLTLAEFSQLKEACKKEGMSTVEFVHLHNIIESLRSVKDRHECNLMKEAQRITDLALEYILGVLSANIPTGITEREVQSKLDCFMLLHGAEALAFPSIVASGKNSANPHAKPTDKRIEQGECIVLDFGAKKNGYCSDMTRTIFVGEPTNTMKRAWEALCSANLKARKHIVPGVLASDVHACALDVLEQHGFKGRMGHALGHGVGLDIHEEPTLSPRNKNSLVCGNVVTVEPGIYIPGEFGMRLEDYGIIGESGFEMFTQSNHNMLVV